MAGQPLERLRLSFVGEAATGKQRLETARPGRAPHSPLVILNANASDLIPQRRWPIERYAALARMLIDEMNAAIVLTGTKPEFGRIEALRRQIGPGPVANLAGQTSVAELIGLYSFASLLVTNDSGPAHFASTTDIPTLALFGPETPRLFGPLGERQEALYLGLACSPCVSVYNQKRSPCGDNQCLKQITVEQAMQAARRLLTSPPAAAPLAAR
jgi:ADP-heptose:LPS heptosyltransferase